MASLIVSYFAEASYWVAQTPVGQETITTSGTTASGTKKGLVACLFSDTAHNVATGTSPNAQTGATFYLPADTQMWIRLNPDEKLAAVTA